MYISKCNYKNTVNGMGVSQASIKCTGSVTAYSKYIRVLRTPITNALIKLHHNLYKLICGHINIETQQNNTRSIVSQQQIQQHGKTSIKVNTKATVTQATHHHTMGALLNSK